jgi:flagellar capping protein FliD
MSMSVDGLISGMDTTSLITKLLQTEAGPQTALKKKLSATQTAASAYRTVNTTFAAVRAAAETALKADSWTATKASSSDTSITVTATSTATPGSLSFSVEKVAASHGVVNRNAGVWTSATAAYGAPTVEVFDSLGVSKGTITVGGTGSLTDAAAAINASSLGLTAAVVEISPTEFALQVNSKTSGAAGEFSLTGAGTFGVTTQAGDAELRIGSGPGAYSVYSATNSFASVMTGATITVSKANPGVPVTVSVNSDPDAVAAKMQTLVDAVNSALTQVKTYTNNAKGSTAALKGDYSVAQLAGQLLDAVSFAIGADGSPAQVGFQLSKDGKITFDKAKFLTALKDDPVKAQRMVAGTAASAGVDGVAGTADDVAATGISGRLLGVAKAASDSATGSLVKMAEGQDSMVKDITDRIEAWDLRLAKRKEALTRQFTAMETALSSLKNQSTWLAGQLNSLSSSS